MKPDHTTHVISAAKKEIENKEKNFHNNFMLLLLIFSAVKKEI